MTFEDFEQLNARNKPAIETRNLCKCKYAIAIEGNALLAISDGCLYRAVDNRVHYVKLATLVDMVRSGYYIYANINNLSHSNFWSVDVEYVAPLVCNTAIELWCEDTVSGANFWKFICKQLFPSISVTHPTIRNKEGNIVWDADTMIDSLSYIDRNKRYLIILDTPLDNQKALDNFQTLVDFAEEHDNVLYLSQYLSFEYAVLTFVDIIKWLSSVKEFSPEELQLLKLFREGDWVGSSVMNSYNSLYSYFKDNFEKKPEEGSQDIHNIEHLFAAVLNQLTSCRGHFVISKGSFGSCWHNSCNSPNCLNRSCSLRLSEFQKAESLYEGTCVHNLFLRGGVVNA